MNTLKKLNKWLKEKAATLQMIICIIWAALAIALLFTEIIDPNLLNSEQHLILLIPLKEQVLFYHSYSFFHCNLLFVS